MNSLFVAFYNCTSGHDGNHDVVCVTVNEEKAYELLFKHMCKKNNILDETGSAEGKWRDRVDGLIGLLQASNKMTYGTVSEYNDAYKSWMRDVYVVHYFDKWETETGKYSSGYCLGVFDSESDACQLAVTKTLSKYTGFNQGPTFTLTMTTWAAIHKSLMDQMQALTEYDHYLVFVSKHKIVL